MALTLSIAEFILLTTAKKMARIREGEAPAEPLWIVSSSGSRLGRSLALPTCDIVNAVISKPQAAEWIDLDKLANRLALVQQILRTAGEVGYRLARIDAKDVIQRRQHVLGLDRAIERQ